MRSDANGAESRQHQPTHFGAGVSLDSADSCADDILGRLKQTSESTMNNNQT